MCSRDEVFFKSVAENYDYVAETYADQRACTGEFLSMLAKREQ